MNKQILQPVTLLCALMVAVTMGYVFIQYKTAESCYEGGSYFASEECEVKLSELFREPFKYYGRMVTVNAIFGVAFEGNHITDHTTEKRVWLAPTESMRREYWNKCGLVGRLQGYFVYGASGHLGMSDGIFEVENVLEVREDKSYPCYSEEELNGL